MNTKPWYASVTVLLNTIGALVVFLTGLTDTFGAQYPKLAIYIALAVKFLNVAKRLLVASPAVLTATDQR